MAELAVELRKGSGKYVSFNMRKTGKIPGILYGKGIESQCIAVELKPLMEFVKTGERIVDLIIDGKKQPALLKELQHGTFDSEINHVDFNAITADTKIRVNVPVEIKGEALGAKEGGIVETALHTLQLECLASSLPEAIYVDVSNLKVGDVILVSDLPKVAGVKILTSGKLAVVTCHVPEEQVAAVADPTTAPVQPEVIGEKERLAAKEAAEKKK